MVEKPTYPIPRWSDCDCQFCNCWTSSSETLHVKSAGSKDIASDAVVFLHGFISSSAFWTETVFPNFSAAANSCYRVHHRYGHCRQAPGKVKPLTLLATLYFPVPEGEHATQYMMRRVAPRRV
ncbi:hypothetical protein MLD38_010400 [Melastoma candidum]|uniref:Uncharacterized protein n=1 Tax=Melastoma candidum TaxID=119954 RepID=A0ACB9R0S9_9MYRT|nr:hypothetical protein MLD38_010400 [Melastoma candidum]